MKTRPWYKRYPSDFIAGTLALTAEEKGVYSTLLDLMYDRGDRIPDNPTELGRICGCSTRQFNIIKERLARLQKIILGSGVISNTRFERQIVSEEKEGQKFKINGTKGAKKTQIKRAAFNQNNTLDEKGLPRGPPADSETHKESRGGGECAREQAFELCQELGKIAGFPDATFWPPGWLQGPLRVQFYLDSGWKPEVMIATARSVMAKKRDGQPSTVTYFERPFARAHAEHSAPLPHVEIKKQEMVVANGSLHVRRPGSILAAIDEIGRELCEKQNGHAVFREAVGRLPGPEGVCGASGSDPGKALKGGG